MRHHFHRCGHLRLLELDAADVSRVRKGGAQIIEELCDAKRLARCVGLAECDVLTPAQKRELLAARATRLREEEPAPSWLGEAPEPRAAELAALRGQLEDDYQAIVAENRAGKLDAAGALRRNPRPLPPGQDAELAAAGMSVFLGDELRELRMARLDAIERAIDAIDRGRYGDCARCGQAIDTGRLRETPGTVVCEACERVLWPDTSRPAWAEEQVPPPRPVR